MEESTKGLSYRCNNVLADEEDVFGKSRLCIYEKRGNADENIRGRNILTPW
jgi:hypothetical protein